MLQTAAKALVRQFFYLEFLPANLSPTLLRGGNYLVLLGEETLELELLDSLKVPRYRIHSVERDPTIATRQSQRAAELGTMLYFGELQEYIAHHLHTNQRFVVLNLDVCGEYRTSIDPVMTDVLLFARRNPRTVVATYSNSARDRAQLREGVRSLAICLRMAPEATDRAVHELYGRYRAAGLKRSVSFNMVLRHFFWVRSHLEHVLQGAMMLGRVKPDSGSRLLIETDVTWVAALDDIQCPMTYPDLRERVSSQRSPRQFARSQDLCPATIEVATYEAANGFYHTGWFAVYEAVEPMVAGDWLSHVLDRLVEKPLRFTNRQAERLESISEGSESVPDNLKIWSTNDFNTARRRWVPAQPSAEMKALVASAMPHTGAAEAKAANAALDPYPLIRSLALQELNVDQIMARLPLGVDVSKGSIAAYVANINR